MVLQMSVMDYLKKLAKAIFHEQNGKNYGNFVEGKTGSMEGHPSWQKPRYYPSTSF